MAKREKRLKKGVESIKKEIKEHFEKIEDDILNEDEDLAKYHIREVNLSLINALLKKLSQLGESSKEDQEFIDKSKNKLEEYKKRLGIAGN